MLASKIEEEENQNEAFGHDIVEEINNNNIEFLDSEKKSLKIKERNQLNLLPEEERRTFNNKWTSLPSKGKFYYYIWLLVTNNLIDSFLYYQYYIWQLGTNNLIDSFLYYQYGILVEVKNMVSNYSHCQISRGQLVMEAFGTFHLEKQIYSDYTNYIVMKDRNKELDKIQQSISAEKTISSSEFVSGQKSAGINVYITVIRNETYRMMANIDIIQSKAMEMLGPERTQIFLDLLADKLPIFRSALAIPGFVPNMAKPAIRDHVISLFEYPRVVMNQIMTSFLSCPDGERLQRMPEPVFRALIERVIEFSLESKSNIAKGLCLEGKRLIVDDFQQFVETLGEKIPEKLLNRLNPGHEAVMYRFGDKNERSQTVEKRDNRLIHSIYFPSDCRLFIYIPTEKGSYWHELEMQRANWFKLRNTI